MGGQRYSDTPPFSIPYIQHRVQVLKQKDKYQQNEMQAKEIMVRGRRYKTLFSQTFAKLERLVC
jgi:hypothetical protein